MVGMTSNTRRFVNVFEVFYNESGLNKVGTIGSYEGKDYKEAKIVFDMIKSASTFSDNKYSVQINEYDGRTKYELIKHDTITIYKR